MEEKKIIDELQNIFRDVFDNNDIFINSDTVAEDIEEWDSLSHIQLIFEVEKIFHVKFTSREMLSWDNIGEMAETIRNKMNRI